MKINKKDVFFILYFLLIYILLIIITNSVIGDSLINLEKKLVFKILSKTLLSSLIVVDKNILLNTLLIRLSFINYCSGIISITTYLSIIFSLCISYKKHIKTIIIFRDLFILFLFNLIRLLIISTTEIIKPNLTNLVHIISWFGSSIIILLLILIKYKKNKS